METLYKLDSKEKLRSWDITVINNGDSSDIITTAGLVDGEKVVNIVTIKEGKNLGRVNQTDHYQQALLEMEAKWKLKARGEYTSDLNNLRHQVLSSGIPSPMLAHKYDPTMQQKGSKNLEKLKLLGAKIHTQPKFDGNRCLIKVNPNGAELYTRKGDKMLPILHIESQILNGYFGLYGGEAEMVGDENVDYKELILDGELFVAPEIMSFNTLNGLLRKEDKSPEQEELLRQVNYHIYDVMKESGYEDRYRLISEISEGLQNIKLVPSFEIEATEDNITEKLEDFLAEGYEGLMIRTLDSPYQNKRSWSLIKVKLFEDEEFRILDVEPDIMGRLGKFIMELNEPVKDRDGKTLTTFKAGTTGLTHEEGYQILANKDNYIGKMATIEFFGKDPRPRFPKFKGLRYE